MPRTVTLFQPPTRPWGMPNMSPFCSKLECYLRMAKIPHEVAVADFRKAPKGKIPFVSIDGELVGDSQLVMERLEAAAENKLDSHLTSEQRAVGHAVQRMLDEAYYFVLVWQRWWADETYAVLRPTFEKMLPGPLRLAMPFIRMSTKKRTRVQGTAKHTPAEIAAFGKADMDSVSAILGNKTFLFGDAPSTFDASAFAFIEGTLGFPYDGEIKRHILATPNLVRYREHVKKTYFADLA